MDENRCRRPQSESHHRKLTLHPSEKQDQQQKVEAHRYIKARSWSEDCTGAGAPSPVQLNSPGWTAGEGGRKTLLGALIASVPKETSPQPISPLVLPKASPGLFLTPFTGYAKQTPGAASPSWGTPCQDPLYSLFNSPAEDRQATTEATPLQHMTRSLRSRQVSDGSTSAKRDAERFRHIMAPHRKRTLPLSMEDSLKRAETFSKKPEAKKNGKRKATGDVQNILRVDPPEPEKPSSASTSTSSGTPQKKRRKRDNMSTASSSPKECIVIESNGSSNVGSMSPSPRKSGDEKAESTHHHQQRKPLVKPTKFQVMLQKTKEQERQKARDVKNVREALQMQK